MSDAKTPEILWPAARQYRHNFGSEELIAGFDYDVVCNIVTELEAEKMRLASACSEFEVRARDAEAENAALVEAARDVVNTAEFDGDISTVDTADLNNLSALLQSEEEI